MFKAEHLPDHPADRHPDEMDLGDRQKIEDPNDVVRKHRHRAGLRPWLAASMAAHVEPQHSPTCREQGGDLFRPDAAVEREAMGHADHRRAFVAEDVVPQVAAVYDRQHSGLYWRM